MTVHFDEDKQNKKLEELRQKEEEALMQALSTKYGIQYIDLTPVPINTDALRVIKEADARAAKMAAFNIVGKKVSVAVHSPQLPETVKVVADLTQAGYTPTLYMASVDSLEKAWNRYKDLSYAIETKAGAIDISGDEITELIAKLSSLAQVGEYINQILAEKKKYKTSRIIEVVLAGALATKASDIHIEPEEQYARLRYRLDGVLNEVLKFDRETFSFLLSRIKLLSGLKLNIKGEAQDGRFSVKIKDLDIEIRTSMLPGGYGESVVLRVLNPKSISVPMEELGIHPRLLAMLEKEITRPNGMVLNTGPTGSGKTTTLYAFLRKVHTPDIKIITIEDPIEYHLPGVVQTQTNSEKGYTFLEGLRSALRQDPDIIMVGEIRDEETAEIAINSALTGHLVFSTLHTNTAAGTFPRLIDLKVNPKILSSAINVAMAQRLVRKLCPECRQEYPLEGEQKRLMDLISGTITTKEDIQNTTKAWRAVGCEKCNKTGYRGRLGIYEAIIMDESIEKVIKENPSEREIMKAAEPQGILNMRQDGVIKILNGTTSFDELSRVIDLEGDY